MLEISGVVDARRQQHDCRILFPCRRDVSKNVEQFLAVIFHRPDPVLGKEIWKNTAHDLPVLNDVGNARRAARVIFENKKIAVAITHQIGAANVDVNVLRDAEVHELRPEMSRLPDVILGNHAIAQNRLAVIDVVQKEIERGDSLFQTAFDFLPFPGGDNSWNQIERKNALGSLGIAINSESHALAQKGKRSEFTFALELVFLQFGETLQQSLVMRPGLSRSSKHLVIELAGIVVGEEFGHEISVSPPLRHANKNERRRCRGATTPDQERQRQSASDLPSRRGFPSWATWKSPFQSITKQRNAPALQELGHSFSPERPAKMARSGWCGFLLPAPAFRRRRFHRRHPPLPDRYRRCNPLPR